MSNIQRELGRRLRDFKFEQDDDGKILFPGTGLLAFGVFEVTNLTRGGTSIAPNLVVTQGLNHILEVVLSSTSAVANWYLAPFAGNVTPAAGWTAANFDTNSTEFTNYTETARQAFSPGAASGGTIGNLSTRAEITIGAGAQTEIYGVGLLSSATKEGTSGVLLSAARLSSSRSGLLENDVIALGYTFTVSDAG